MCSVHVRIRHNDNLVIAQLRDVKIKSVPFGESAAKGVDHGLDLGVCKNLVDRGFLHVEDLAADRQNRLKVAVPGRLGRASRGVSLYNKDLTLFRIPALAVCELPV